MAKIAVIFVLFALCSVAMSARVPREEPNAFQPFLDSLKTLTESANKFLNDPATKAKIEDIQKKGEELGKKGLDQIQAAAGELQQNLQELAKKSEGPIKEFTEAAKKALDDATNTKKN